MILANITKLVANASPALAGLRSRKSGKQHRQQPMRIDPRSIARLRIPPWAELRLLPTCAYRRVFPSYPVELEKAVGSCTTLLDVGCGENSPIRHFSRKPYCVGVDAFVPSIRKSRGEGIHDKYYNMNILEVGKRFKPDSFDCVLASDAIEHLTKAEGLRLLAMMEKIAREKVIVFTPNGFLPQGEFDNNPWQRHKSSWTSGEMGAMGYKVTGINGWKPLRGAYALIRLKPRFFWSVISDITQLFVRNRPRYAFQILCVKRKVKK